MKQLRQRPTGVGSRIVLPAVLGTAALLVGAPKALATTDTWSGANSASSPKWSVAGNWTASTAPQSGDELSFQDCAPTACLGSTDDLGALSTPQLSIADNLPYVLTTTGGTLTLDPAAGNVGLKAQPITPSTHAAGAPAVIAIPLTLGTDQTWDVTGPGAVSVTGAVAGDHTLSVNLADSGSLALEAEPNDVDTDGISVTGDGTLILGGSVNAGGGSINVDGADLQLGDSRDMPEGGGGEGVNDVTTGPLTITGGGVTIGGQSSDDGPGTTTVEGAVSLDSASTTRIELEGTGNTAGTDYGQLTATGDIQLHGALSLVDEGPTSGCAPAGANDTDTLLTTSGTLSGQFTGLGDGSVTEVPIICPGEVVKDFPAVIHYTSHAVTATFLPPVATSTALSASTTTPAPGADITYTATVAPSPSPSGAWPTGTVTFYADGTTAVPCHNAGDYTVVGGKATCTFPAAAGSYTVTAVYSGDGAFNGSTSPAVTITPGGTSTGGASPTTGGGTTTGTTGGGTQKTGGTTGKNGTTGKTGTSGTSSGGGSPGSPSSGHSSGSGRAVLESLHTHGAAIRVKLRCPSHGANCVATLRLTRTERTHPGGVATRRIVSLGSRRVRLDAGKSHVWTVGLNAAGRQMLAGRHHRLRLTVRLQDTINGHQRALATRSVVLR